MTPHFSAVAAFILEAGIVVVSLIAMWILRDSPAWAIALWLVMVFFLVRDAVRSFSRVRSGRSLRTGEE
jgi:hypothetical protein